VEDRRGEGWLWFLIVILCAIAAGKVVVQDAPRIRFTVLHNDVQQLYLGSRVWMRGQNPYTTDALFSEMKRTNPDGVADLEGPCTEDCELYYPPSALPLMAIPALMPWKSFHFLYLASCVLVYLFVLYRLSLLIERPVHRWLFISLGLAFGPYHAGLNLNNISVLLIPLLLFSTLCFNSAWAFALIGVIACLKPPLALVLLFYFLLRKDKRVLTVSLPIILAVSGVSLLRLRSTGWRPSYMARIHQYSSGGGTMGVAYHGILNYGFSNLQALFYALFHSVRYAVVGNYVTLIVLAVLFTWLVLKWPAQEMSLNVRILTLSIVACLTLFQTSLQYYNYVFLLAAGVFALRHRTPAVRLGLMAALCSFVLPPGLLLSVSQHTREPLNTALHLALPSAKYQLTRTQELLVCTPSIIFLLITTYLMGAFQARSKNLVLRRSEP
jgi:hypothetical protein